MELSNFNFYYNRVFEKAYNGLAKKLVGDLQIKNITEGNPRTRFAFDNIYPKDINIISSDSTIQFSGTYKVDVREHRRRLSNGTVANIDAYSYDLEDQRIVHYYTKEGEEKYRTMGSANIPTPKFVGEVVNESHNILTDQLAETLRRTGYEVSVTKG